MNSINPWFLFRSISINLSPPGQDMVYRYSCSGLWRDRFRWRSWSVKENMAKCGAVCGIVRASRWRSFYRKTKRRGLVKQRSTSKWSLSVVCPSFNIVTLMSYSNFYVRSTILIRHPNILDYIGSDMTSRNSATQLWVVTHHHPYGSLYDYLNHTVLTSAQLLKICQGIANGLDHLHTEIFGSEVRLLQLYTVMNGRK